MNLSPYWIVVQSIIETMGWEIFLREINKNIKKKRGNIFPIIQELERPENINLDNFPYIREIGSDTH